MYKYIKHSDGKTLAVNTTTGEVSDTFNATLPVGSMTFTPEQQKNYHKQKQKERARQEQTLNRNPSRSFYFLKNNNEFNELKAADVARLIVLATYIRYDRDSNKDNKLLLDTGEPLTSRDIPYLLKISEKTAKRFINNVTPKYLKITDTGLLFTNHFYFCKGICNFASPDHPGNIGKSHQKCRKIISRKNLFVHLVVFHDFDSAATTGCSQHRNSCHADCFNIAVDCSRRNFKHFCNPV